MAVMAFLLVKISGMFMTAIFMLFSRNRKRFRKRKTEVTGKYSRESFADGKRCISKAKKKHRVPDTAHDCPILRIGVVHDQPVSERKNLWNVELFSFFDSQFLHHETTVISILA